MQCVPAPCRASCAGADRRGSAPSPWHRFGRCPPGRRRARPIGRGRCRGRTADGYRREQIREKLSEGWTEEQIYDLFVNLYGDRVLAEPPRRGFNWLVYVIPPVAFLAGVVILYMGFQRWRKPVEEIAAEAPPVVEKDEYVSRLEEELKNRN